jgi:V8-like Glu-specific endopeptidase
MIKAIRGRTVCGGAGVEPRKYRRRFGAGGLVCGAALVSTGWSCSGEYEERQTEPLGVLEAANNCGEPNYQDVELYDGEFGVPEALVDATQSPVGQGHTSDGACSGTLIARDIFLSAGHCQYAVGDEVWFNHQLDSNGVPRNRIVHTVVDVIQQIYDLDNVDPVRRTDFAVVRLSGTPGNTFGYLRLANEEARTATVTGQLLTAIAFPNLNSGGFNYKVVSTGPYDDPSDELLPNWFGAQVDTLRGSSGCGIIRVDGQMIGLHTTAGCGDSGNNNMRMPVLFEQSQFLQQILAMQGVHFANVDGVTGADAMVVNFNRVAGRLSNGSTQFNGVTNWTSNAYYGQNGTYFADVTGDGKADAIVVNSTGITVRRSNGSTFNDNELWTTTPFKGGVGTFFADVTGDGRADAIALHKGSITVRSTNIGPPSGTSFTSARVWSGDAFLGTLGTFFADVTNDGRADVIAVSDDLVRVRRSTGAAFGATENWTSRRFFGALGTFVADVDNDGRADLIAVNNGITTVRRSTGSAFGAGENWLLASHFGSLGTHFVDVTGDRRADSIAVTPLGVTVRPSTGSSFGTLRTWSDVPYFGAR